MSWTGTCFGPRRPANPLLRVGSAMRKGGSGSSGCFPFAGGLPWTPANEPGILGGVKRILRKAHSLAWKARLRTSDLGLRSIAQGLQAEHLEEIERLATQRAVGDITEEEYQAAMAKLLG